MSSTATDGIPTAAGDDRPPKAPLTSRTRKYMVKRVLTEFTRDGGTDQAAKLTYFMVLSIAPTMLALFSLAALVLSGFQEQIAQLITSAIEDSGAAKGANIGNTVDSTVQSLMGSTGGGTIGLIIGIATALWSASAYVKAFSRTANEVFDVPEGRGPVRSIATMLGVTAAVIVGILIVLIAVLLNQSIVDGLLGPIAGTIGATGLLDFLTQSFLPIWAWVKWPVILVLLFAILSLLYWATPNVKRPYRLVSPGGVFAIVGIAVAAVALVIYMTTIASYSSYGAIGGIMAVLFALWVINIVIILGAEVDAEYERAKELASGRPAEGSLTAPLRDDKAAVKSEQKYEKLVDQGRDLRLENLHHNGEEYTDEKHRLTPRTGQIKAVSAEDPDAPAVPEPEAESTPDGKTTD